MISTRNTQFSNKFTAKDKNCKQKQADTAFQYGHFQPTINLMVGQFTHPDLMFVHTDGHIVIQNQLSKIYNLKPVRIYRLDAPHSGRINVLIKDRHTEDRLFGENSVVKEHAV